jgi:16S rRNA (adenine1518-N6/adenine1519-N6)-dimethyltransferase
LDKDTQQIENIEDPRRVLKRYGLKPKYTWGQNFLVSRGAIAKIARACVDEPGRKVIEIGAGLGTLTGAILELGGHVIAVERDREMCRVLRSEFGHFPNFTLEEADAKKYDYRQALGDGKGVIAGNLPYQLTGPIVRIITEIGSPMQRSVIMVQKEVAERIMAGPGKKGRSAFSVMVQARVTPKIIHRLPPSAFHPKPKVDSAVLTLEPLEEPVLKSDEHKLLFDRVVKAAFSSRRKTLKNSMISGRLAPREPIEAILAHSGIDPQIRAERLTLDDFYTLCRFLSQQMNDTEE